MRGRAIHVSLLLGFVFGGMSCWPGVCRAQQLGQPLLPPWCLDLPRAVYKTLERVEVADEWFEVYRVRPDVYAIYEPRQFVQVISYLIVGSDRALLFDTGMGIGTISAVVKRLTPLPVTVLNSHTHYDHIGGNSEFRSILGMKTNFTLDNALGMPNARVREAVEPAHICGRLPDEIDPDSYSIHAFQITEFVKEGYRIDLGGRILEVVLTPGHTPDSLCLLDRKNGLLFPGDTFYAGPIYLVTPAGDFGAYAKSVEKLAKLAPALELLLPAHNEPIADPSNLKKLSVAVRQIQTGEAQPKVNGGKREFVFEGFSLVLAAGK